MKPILTFPTLTFPTLATLGLFAALLAPACTQTSADPLASLTGFCEEKAKAECQITAVCAIDPTTCLDHRQSLCMTDAQAATTTSTRTYNAGNAQKCIDTLNSAYGGNATIVPYAKLKGPGSIADVCGRVFSGNAALYSSCQSDDDCAGSAICAVVTPGATAKVCANATAVSANSLCTSPGSVCATDTYCAVLASGAAVCTPSAALGASCAGGVACVSAARCVGTTCVAREAPGGGCTSDDQCGSDPYCDPASQVCAIGLTFAQGSTDCVAFIAEDGGSPVVSKPVVDAAASTGEASAAPAADASTE
jgi:hypothetical protein